MLNETDKPQWSPSSHAGLVDKTERLPLAGLSALTASTFITLLTEILPAGLLTAMASGMQTSESVVGQFITAYALGSFAGAFPATALTRGMRRKPLLVGVVLGFALVNLVTAFSTSVVISIAARFLAGVFGGIVWSLLGGYAVRMTPASLAGKAIAISSAGATLALVVGMPIGSALGRAIGWQAVALE